MARMGLIQRGGKIRELVNRYRAMREDLRAGMREASSLDDRWDIYKKLQYLPRNSAPTRLHRRCLSTGRPRANYRDFGLSRHVLREMAHACLSPGLVRSSR
uniref:Small ribosomal subunit protein uS14c n=1 Tax=Selaginella kraussiana TaxID=81964 RepID=A0A3Q9R2R5_9TRAC|nr:ribosomal protein S14 [Selaginella kraussiana]AZU95822.1 ribosomal protein S14 [Selaginella kraussiana]